MIWFNTKSWESRTSMKKTNFLGRVTYKTLPKVRISILYNIWMLMIHLSCLICKHWGLHQIKCLQFTASLGIWRIILRTNQKSNSQTRGTMNIINLQQCRKGKFSSVFLPLESLWKKWAPVRRLITQKIRWTRFSDIMSPLPFWRMFD
jgi:hypothetical protein